MPLKCFLKFSSITLIRFIKNLIIFLLITTPLELIGLPILAITLLILPTSQTTLPTFLHWYDVWDNPDGGGINGDNNYIAQYGISYWSRFNYIALRNPLNYFQYAILGMVRDSTQEKPLINMTKGNWSYISIQNHEGIYYEYYYSKSYNIFGLSKQFIFRMGWKLDANTIHKGVTQWCFDIRPCVSA